MPRGRHRQSSPLSRLLPPTACGVLAIASLISAVFTSDPTVLRVLVVAASVGAFAGAVLLKLREHTGDVELEAEIAARARDEARFEDRTAELEFQAETAEEQVKRLDRRLLAQRAQITRIEAENARLLRERARAAAEQAAREAEEARRRELAARGTRPTPTAYLKAAAALRGMERRAAVGQAQRIAAQAATPQPAAAANRPAPEPLPAAGAPRGTVQTDPARTDLFKANPAQANPARTNTVHFDAAQAEPASRGSVSAGPVQAGATPAGSALDALAATRHDAAAAPAAASVPSGSTAVSATRQRPGAEGSGAPAAASAPVTAAPGGPAWARAALPPMRPASAVLPTALTRSGRQSRDLLSKDEGSSGTFNFFTRQEAAISTALGDLADVVGDEAAAAQQLYSGDRAADPAQPAAATEDGQPEQLVDLTADDETEPIDVRALRAV